MAIFGIGAYYNGTEDVTDKFLKKKGAFIGWPEADAPSLHRILRSLKVGDIVYIKSFPTAKKRLAIKAVGIVKGDETFEVKNLGVGRPVYWIPLEEPIVIEGFEDKNNVYNNTIYEEYNDQVRKLVLGVLLKRMEMKG